MNPFRTVVGIDPSGRRLSIVAVQGGVGSPSATVPPAVVELRADRESARLEEIEGALHDFVARTGLSGASARICVPADRVYTARVVFPPLRARDLRPALAMELDRLFPFPAAKLRFKWRRLGVAPGGKGVRLLVVAVPSSWLDQWEEIVSRAGLVLEGAVPCAWAVGAVLDAIERGGGRHPAATAFLRDAGGAAECTLLSGGEPWFCASRPCAPENVASEATALLEEGMEDAPPPVAGLADMTLVAPPGWFAGAAPASLPVPVPVAEGFEPRARRLLRVPGEPEADVPAWEAAGAFGAAIAGASGDLLAPEREGPWRFIGYALASVLAAAALALSIAWPSIVIRRAQQDLARLDARVAALRPVVAQVEESVDAIQGLDERIAVLREASAGRDVPLAILRDLTERLPQGTWLTGLRIEGAKVEMDGLSPSANDIFQPLSRDGLFRKVEFASPITRQPDNLERFQIRAEFAAPPAPAAQPPTPKAEAGGRK